MCRFRGVIFPRIGDQSSVLYVPFCEILGKQRGVIDYMYMDDDRAPFCPLIAVPDNFEIHGGREA